VNLKEELLDVDVDDLDIELFVLSELLLVDFVDFELLGPLAPIGS